VRESIEIGRGKKKREKERECMYQGESNSMKEEKRNIAFGSTICKFHQHCTNVLCTAFLPLQFGFVIFWQKNILAQKLLVKF
jgi:hypothetical protein